MRRFLQSLTFVAILMLLLTSIVTAQSEQTILSILAKDGHFTTLLAAIEITETEQAFSEGHWTLFAPTDEAFAQIGLNPDNIATQLTLKETADLLLYQAMSKELTSDGAKLELGDVTMANGWQAGLKWYDDTLWVNDDARVTTANIFAANGIIHVVDQVITPPWPRTDVETEVAFMATLKEMKLLQAEEAGEEAEAMSAAPTAAAEEAPETEGGEIGEEGVVEIVTIPQNSLLGVMVKDGRFSTYLAAVAALDLVEPYVEGEWTLFAPTDDAFAELGITASNITSEYSVGELADLLLYHALDEEVSVDKAKTMLGDITTRSGKLAGLKYFDGSIWVNDNARVITADIRADNGIIHAINAVIERPWPRVETEDDPTEDLTQSGDTP